MSAGMGPSVRRGTSAPAALTVVKDDGLQPDEERKSPLSMSHDADLAKARASITAQAAAWRAAQPQCTPCFPVRAVSSGMLLVVLALVAVTYYPYVINNPVRTPAAVFSIAVFHILLGLMLVSYVQVIVTDAGGVPEWWVNAVMEHSGAVAHEYCKKTCGPKPPRSHYDRLTQRLVLNMDHFCPWVANTVGFYNRKFFVLFLVYCSMTCLWAAGSMVLVFPTQTLPWVAAGRRCRPAFIRGTVSRTTCPPTPPSTPTFQSLMLVALLFDTTFGLMLICFAAVHIQMALTNETTIEGRRYNVPFRYDVGRRRNWEQVFGTKPLLWFLPVWGSGPAGDGLSWPTLEEEDVDEMQVRDTYV
eukprot:TRINITY_DN47540_c0_g1_i1.p1 TRINITY_DN47540_c0_g1~~TRINITY_DN47540_c0_g1_i1.p1  ORF type:complete len:375 (+),score=57.79 TRINITY_DN47540_c0_g1_i1:52-1125(+)